MTIKEKIRVKLQYDVNREVPKISTGNIDKYHYQAKLINMNISIVEEISLSDQSKMIQQTKFTYSLLEKAFEKQTNPKKNKLKPYMS